MKTLNKLYPYLNNQEILKGEQYLIKILLKIGKFSEISDAQKCLDETFKKKLTGEELTKMEREIVTVFNRVKREKSPTYQALKNLKGIHRTMPNNSKLTF